MMFGVTGTALATNRVSVTPVKPSKSIYKVITADWFWALCIVIGAVLIPAPSPNASTVLGLPKLCIFRNITGIACPGCGMTRSLIASAHLHFTDAIAFHPLGPPVLVLLITYCASRLVFKVNNKRDATLGHRWVRVVPLILSGCFIVVWVARLLGVLPTPS